MRSNRVKAAFVVLSLCLITSAQDKPEYVSSSGRSFFSNPDEKGAVAEAEQKLAANPKDVDLIIALGRAQGSVWRFRDAIATFNRGFEINPKNAMLYRHRGHRYISTRQLDKAVVDLEEAARLDDKNFDIWYHVGLARYLNGSFLKAAEAYERGRAVAASDDSLASISHWLYMSYRRAKKESEAAQVLERISPDLKVTESKAYLSLLLFYKGLKKEGEIYSATGMADVDAATIGYGVANWHLYSGNPAKAKEYFQRVTEGKAWAAFGFIGSEVELARMR